MQTFSHRFCAFFLSTLVFACTINAMENPQNSFKAIACGINQLSFEISAMLMTEDENIAFYN